MAIAAAQVAAVSAARSNQIKTEMPMLGVVNLLI